MGDADPIQVGVEARSFEFVPEIDENVPGALIEARNVAALS